MTIIDLAVARAHLRLEDDYPADQFALKLAAAEEAAGQFLNRRLFADVASRDTAISGVVAELTAAREQYEADLSVAQQSSDPVFRSIAMKRICDDYRVVQAKARETYAGVVITPQIEAAILLTLGHLFENRQDVQQGTVGLLPIGAEQLLFPFRVDLGV